MTEHKRITELAKEAGLPDTTTRRYIGQFKEYFPSKREGRTRLFPEEGAETLKEIAKLYSQGLTAPQVEERLRGKYEQTIEIETEETSLTVADRERELQSRERLAQALETLANQKEKLLELDRADQALAEKNRELERELSELRDRLDRLEGKDRGPWWKRLLKA